MQENSQLATIIQLKPLKLELSGCWDAQYMAVLERQVASIHIPDNANIDADCSLDWRQCRDANSGGDGARAGHQSVDAIEYDANHHT